MHPLLKTFQKTVEGMENYSLILLDVDGTILTWNKGAEKLKGYSSHEIIGQHYSIFYLPQDRQAKLPEKLIREASVKGNASFMGRRIRKNGTIFWGKVDMSAIKDENDRIIGYTKLARELSDETTIGNYWFDHDGILHTKASSNPHTPEAITEFRSLLSSALNGQKICVIADVRDALLTEDGNSFTQPGLTSIYKAVAFISDYRVDTNTARMLELLPKEIPSKVFHSQGMAKDWIKRYNLND